MSSVVGKIYAGPLTQRARVLPTIEYGQCLPKVIAVTGLNALVRHPQAVKALVHLAYGSFMDGLLHENTR